MPTRMHSRSCPSREDLRRGETAHSPQLFSEAVMKNVKLMGYVLLVFGVLFLLHHLTS